MISSLITSLLRFQGFLILLLLLTLSSVLRKILSKVPITQKWSPWQWWSNKTRPCYFNSQFPAALLCEDFKLIKNICQKLIFLSLTIIGNFIIVLIVFYSIPKTFFTSERYFFLQMIEWNELKLSQMITKKKI